MEAAPTVEDVCTAAELLGHELFPKKSTLHHFWWFSEK